MAALLAGLLLLASAASGGCPLSIGARADGSFAQAGYRLSPRHLERLAGQTRDRFVAPARRLCLARVLRPSDLEKFGELIVQNGEGATEPVIYREENMPRRTFVLQYAFQGGGPPEVAAFEQALRCWKRPRGPGCDYGD
ncbi:MAG TPA: hypothetical protein VFQ67_04350 [Allosphingosinicella sp.]|jgi:hypothetical protein|nr:hypothetical protein [Allosphingosinicella sp.]